MDCPTCGKSLSSERGMRQHHTKVHDDPLPNRTCKGCGDDFYDPKARLIYCEECDPNEGANNGNWKGGKERTACERCGSEFEYYPSNKKGVFCPECVRKSDEFLGDHYAEVHDIEPVERECEHCGGSFSVLPCFLRQGGGKFCSRDCLHAELYGGRRSEPAAYSGDWYEVRRRARDRDNHRCQYCGKSRDEIGQEPDVHHITPVRDFDDPQDAHTLDNLVSLCRSCHRYAEVGQILASEIRPDSAQSRNE